MDISTGCDAKERGRTDEDAITIFELGACDPLTIDVGSMTRAEVLDEHPALGTGHARMLRADSVVIHGQLGEAVISDGERIAWLQREDAIQVGAIEESEGVEFHAFGVGARGVGLYVFYHSVFCSHPCSSSSMILRVTSTSDSSLRSSKVCTLPMPRQTER